MSTPHNHAKIGEIAKTVLMPGDPRRAKFIADTFLENVVMFNDVRNMYGFTGTYQGHTISVMGSGMGMPSIGIYSYELFTTYGVENIIRIGSAGSYHKDVHVYDVILADSAWSESSFAKTAFNIEDDVLYPSQTLNQALLNASKILNIDVKLGRVHSSDVFYRDAGIDFETIAHQSGSICVEMESFALFANAQKLGKHAACLVTISDSLVTHEATTPQERQESFTKMMQVALQMAKQ